MWDVFEPLLPIVLLVVAGVLLRRFGFYGEEFRKTLDRFVYWVALPALLLVKLAAAEQVGGAAWPMLGAFATATTVVALLMFVVCRLARVADALEGVLVQAALRGNLAFVALPVVILADPTDDATITNTLLVMGPTIVLYNVLGVAALVAAHETLDAKLLGRMGRTMATNPFILACVAGLALQFAGFRVPMAGDASDPLEQTLGLLLRSTQRTLELLGQTAAPLALLSLGGAMVAFRVRDHVGLALLSTTAKCAALPALTWWLATMWGVTGPDLRAVVVLGSAPTAVASYVLAGQLRGDQGLAAATIVVSTVVSAGALALALSLG